MSLVTGGIGGGSILTKGLGAVAVVAVPVATPRRPSGAGSPYQAYGPWFFLRQHLQRTRGVDRDGELEEHDESYGYDTVLDVAIVGHVHELPIRLETEIDGPARLAVRQGGRALVSLLHPSDSSSFLRLDSALDASVSRAVRRVVATRFRTFCTDPALYDVAYTPTELLEHALQLMQELPIGHWPKEILSMLQHLQLGEVRARAGPAILFQVPASLLRSAGRAFADIEVHQQQGKLSFFVTDGPYAIRRTVDEPLDFLLSETNLATHLIDLQSVDVLALEDAEEAVFTSRGLAHMVERFRSAHLDTPVAS